MKKIFHNKMIYLFQTGLVLGISSVLAYSYVAQDVGFTPRDTSWHVENTKEALDDLYDSIKCDDELVNTVWDFYYSGATSMFVPPCKGKYKLEVWGAQGGSYNSTYYGGYGGYAIGYLYVQKPLKLYVTVGQAGTGPVASSAINSSFNGGAGVDGWTDSNEKRGSGGGATHIANLPGELYMLESNKNSVYIYKNAYNVCFIFSTNSSLDPTCIFL